MIDISGTSHKFITPKVEKAAIVMITSDEGFMGDLNFQVVDLALLRDASKSAELVVVGESGERHLKDMGRQCTAFKSAPTAEGRFALAKEIKEYISKGIAEDRFGKVIISYPDPVSFMIQKVEIIDLFPLTAFFSKDEKKDFDQSMIMESPIEGIIEYLAEEFIEQKLMELLEDSKLSEFAARAAHLERSGQELVEKKKHLRLQYFHAYHEFIDKNTRELFSSQIIIKRKARELAMAESK
jgi:ATP synthase F1 gamma subunit